VPRVSELSPSERPRERLLRVGADDLSDAELLSIVLGGSLDSAVALAGRFDDLRRMAVAGVAELAEARGVGLAQACRVKAALALAGRLARPFTRGDVLGGPADVFEHVGLRLAPLEREVFVALSLDAKNRILREHRLAEGGVCSVEVLPRDVFAAIVREAAAAVVFVHNHPSGDPTPSPADEELTRRLTSAGHLVGVSVLDHVIVGRGGYYAFSNLGNFCPRPPR
jgi:DNA repair protein RadC